MEIKKIAALFPGQGSQSPGMGKDLFDRFDCVKSVYAAATDILGFDVPAKSFSGDDITDTRIAQPLIFTLSVASFRAFLESAEQADITAFAGHSLGEYAALVCAGGMSLEMGLSVIGKRARLMAEAAEGGMSAVMGLTAEEIEAVCTETDGYVLPVNYNSPAQTVIAGEMDALARCESLLADKGAKVVRLNVSAAFHSKLMQTAADRFYEELAGTEITTPARFYSNVTGGLLASCDMRVYLRDHMISPVRFTAEVNSMAADGVTAFIECGPGKTLAGLVKRIIKGAEFLTI